MLNVFVFAFAAGVIFISIDAKSINLINSDGVCRSVSQISKFLSEGRQTDSAPINLVEFVDCISDVEERKSGYSFLNRVFGTEFVMSDSDRNGD